MARSHPAAADILARAGRRGSDRLAAETRARRDHTETSEAISAEMRGRESGGPSYVALAKTRATYDGGVDERVLARELGRDRLHRMLSVLDDDERTNLPRQRSAAADHQHDEHVR